jgi:hypothetical protein
MTSSHPDPLAGDFDEELGNLDSSDVQMVQPSREHHLIAPWPESLLVEPSDQER